MNIWIILGFIALICIAILVSIIRTGLIAGRQQDDRMDDLINKAKKQQSHAKNH